MDYDLSTVKILPQPSVQVINEHFLMCWNIELSNETDDNALSLVSNKASVDNILITLQYVKDKHVNMLVRWSENVESGIIWGTSYRAFLLIEFYLCPISTIQGLDRIEWRTQFTILEHEGFLEQDKDALIHASEKGDEDKVLGILSADNKTINLKSISGKTALVYACLRGYIEVARILILNGANINIINSEITPLQAAVASRNYNLVFYLLNMDAEVNLRNKYGETALMYAVSWEEKVIVELLLNKGANPSLKNKKGVTALNLARQSNQQEIVNLLEQTRTILE